MGCLAKGWHRDRVSGLFANVKSPIASKSQLSFLFPKILQSLVEMLGSPVFNSIIDPLLDRFRFAYRENRSVNDAV